MKKSEKPVLQVLQGIKPEKTPVWLMRQAGRYLPEYRALRAKADSFLELCLSPEWATEITLQPLRRFDLDAAIVFADILLVPFAFGQKLEYRDAAGPVLEPITQPDDLAHLSWDVERISPVFETLDRIKDELDPSKTLLGFAGGLWTVACYMMEGQGKNGFTQALKTAKTRPDFVKLLLERLEDATLEYLGRQIEAGAEALYLFESWAGLLDERQFNEFVIEPTARLVKALKLEYPDVPVIGFPKGAGPENTRRYTVETGIDALAIDQTIPLFYARDELQKIKPLQGNLDPALVVAGGAPMINAASEILTTLASGTFPHIFSLGHGVLPETEPEHIESLLTFVHTWAPA